MTRTRISRETRQKARSLRHSTTKAEGLLFRRQSPIGPYIVDFVCLRVRLVVEIDGDLHETERGRRHDANRDAYLSSLGFAVMRIDEPDIIANYWAVAQDVREKAELLIGDPTRPLRGHPPLKGEGTRAAAIWTGKVSPQATEGVDQLAFQGSA